MPSIPPLTTQEIITEIETRLAQEAENLKESRKDVSSPGFNQDLGARDALANLLDWIKQNVPDEN